MEITRTTWGEIVTIPATENNTDFSYDLRSVRRINNNDPEEQELLAELEPKEQRARRKFLILAHSMEQFFRTLSDGSCRHFDEWEKKNKMDWNEWYHWQLHDLEEEVNSFSFEYARRSHHGYCV